MNKKRELFRTRKCSASTCVSYRTCAMIWSLTVAEQLMQGVEPFMHRDDPRFVRTSRRPARPLAACDGKMGDAGVPPQIRPFADLGFGMSDAESRKPSLCLFSALCNTTLQASSPQSRGEQTRAVYQPGQPCVGIQAWLLHVARDAVLCAGSPFHVRAAFHQWGYYC